MPNREPHRCHCLLRYQAIDARLHRQKQVVLIDGYYPIHRAHIDQNLRVGGFNAATNTATQPPRYNRNRVLLSKTHYRLDVFGMSRTHHTGRRTQRLAAPILPVL